MAHTVFETDGPIATLTFNRPEARNAMTWEICEALVDACDRVDRDAAIRVLIFAAPAARRFVAGTDIAQFQNFKNREDGVEIRGAAGSRARSPRARDQADDRAGRRASPPAADAPSRSRCDLRVATPEATFGDPDRAHARQLPVRRQLQPAARRRWDPARSKDMLFTGRLIGGVEAHALGIVNRLVPADEIEATVARACG